jgi:hypothetical protein
VRAIFLEEQMLLCPSQGPGILIAALTSLIINVFEISIRNNFLIGRILNILSFGWKIMSKFAMIIKTIKFIDTIILRRK